MEIERHPLEPFLPANARLLMLGSFPPQKKRWSMEFYYPNWNNDMWRIVGLLFFNTTVAGQCIRQISGSCRTYGYRGYAPSLTRM